MAIDVKFTLDSIKIDVSLLTTEQFIPFAEKEISFTHARQGNEWQQGKSWDSQPISSGSYSKPYAKYRQRKGRRTSPVDLIFSGDLKGSLQVRRTDDGAEGFFMSTPHPNSKLSNAELTQALVAKGYDLPNSQFGEADKERILKNYDLEVKKIIESLITVDKKG